MRRVHRSALQRDNNHALVRSYTTELTRIFDDWAGRVDGRGYSSSSLTAAMNAAAEQLYPRAFALGRHQAYPKARPAGSGEGVLRQRLLLNRHYLENSLAPAIDRRAAEWQLDKESIPLSQALTQSFRSRVQMYGGAIWPVTEAGFLAGLHEARADLAIRMTGHLMAEEDDEQPQPGDHALAFALGLTAIGLLALLRVGRSRAGTTAQPNPDQQQMVALPDVLDSAGISMGVERVCEDDDNSCEDCPSLEGEYTDDAVPLPGGSGEQCGNNCRCYLQSFVSESLAA